MDLSALAPLLPPGLQPAVAQPFPLVVAGVGSDIPIGGMPQDTLTEESLTAYEVSYAGVLPRGTTLGGSFFVNRRDDAINFTALPPSLDPYTATHPPPGWRLPPGVLTQLAQFGIFLPRTAFTYLNLGPIRQTGVELWLEQRVSRAVAASINYSWQSEPEILDDPNPHLPAETQPAPDAPIQRRGDMERLAAPGFRVGERRHRRVLERRPHVGVSPRPHRRVRDRERQRRGEVAGRCRHDHGEGNQRVQPDHPIAHLR